MLIMNKHIAKQEAQWLVAGSKPEKNIPENNVIVNEEIINSECEVEIPEQRQDIVKEKATNIDVPLKVSVLLGRTKKNINEVLSLGSGSIIELEKMADEPVDILVNDTLIARGEVVAVNEYFGVRITDIISPENRIRSLVRR